MKNIIIFTDLDGTLLNYSNYSFKAALPALNKIKEMNIPLVVCSSKTKKEIEFYRQKLNNNHPFISENGGGIFIPKDYFRFEIADSGFKIVEIDNYLIIRLGTEYNELRNVIGELRKAGFKIRGFGDMTVKEISELTGLDDREAIMTKERDFDEPFVFEGNEEEMASLFESIRSKGLRHTRGEFFHLLGNTDKGRAVRILIELYRRVFNDLLTVAIGDNLNDVPMLEVVDYPIIVQRFKGIYDSQINISNLIKADGIGPIGWNNAILKILSVLN